MDDLEAEGCGVEGLCLVEVGDSEADMIYASDV
jgi:hypothetical protein